jgi:tellurite resistance protein TerC
VETIDAWRERGEVTVVKWVARVRAAVGLNLLPAPLRKLIVAVIGITILLLGVAMVVLPGPAFIVIPVGLGILATEFAWARRAIRRARVMIAKARGRESGKARATANTSR